MKQDLVDLRRHPQLQQDAGISAHPLTGEAIDLVHAPNNELARFLDGLKEDQRALREAQSIVEEEVIRRMDHEGQYTMRAGPYTLRSGSPEPSEEFDALALRSDLLELADRGVISVEAVDRAVVTIVEYRAQKRGINALRKLPTVRETIERHARMEQKHRRVRVERTT